MKKKFVPIIVGLLILILIVTLFLELFIVNMIFAPDRSEREYDIIRLNSESNEREEGEDYLLRYMNEKKILQYSFDTGEVTEHYIEVSEGIYVERGGVVAGDCIYYVLSDNTVRKYNCGKQIDEEVLSLEDVLRLYKQEELSEYFSIMIKSYGECLLLSLGDYRKEYTFVCPIDGDLKTDCIEVNDLFPKGNKTGMEEETVYQGIHIRRYYDAEKERYVVLEVREAESGRIIFTNKDSVYTMKADENLVSLSHKWGTRGYFYSVGEELEEYEIDCLNGSEYEYSVIQRDKLAVENGEIIGLLHVVKNGRCDPYNPSQKALKYDMLFRLNPETGESSILYSTRNNHTRIIGYRNGVIYLMNDYKIYTKTAGRKGKELFLELPPNYDYMFDWQGDYLIVVCEYEILGAYKIC